MADALSDVGYTRATFLSELADEQVVVGKLLGGRGSIMVKEEDSGLRTSQAFEATFPELPYRQRSCTILGEDGINGSYHDIASAGIAI